MKKVNLANLKLGSNDRLQREQLKTILGGGYTPWQPGHLYVACTNSSCVTEVPNCSNPDQYCPPGETAVFCQ